MRVNIIFFFFTFLFYFYIPSFLIKIYNGFFLSSLTSLFLFSLSLSLSLSLVGCFVGRLVRGYRHGSEWFEGRFVVPIGLWVHGYQLGLWVLVWLCRGYQCGCVVVRGFQHGSICLISIKFCYGLISDLV